MLGDVLPQEAFGFILISMRLAAIFLVIPVLGDRSIPRRVRAGFAILLTLVIYPSVQAGIPALPDSIVTLTVMAARELLIGSMIGMAMRFLMSATHVAGSVIAFQTGLAAAQSFDPAQGTQSVIVAAFMNLVAVTLILVTDLHHMMIMAIVYSYTNFPIGEAIPYADFATAATQSVSSSFALGFQMAAPFIVYAMVFNISLGLISRMIPGFQVFFVGLPLNLAMGFLLMALLLGALMSLFLGRFEELLLGMLG
ncbi:flagellar biosynthetic protein FliR [Kordiimonas laminariae]|uniref:flagellar biosynthetic protein FliR n=1 Tax=Kordiimonas laminariae TaxID=2917717 RepID=UPI001FF41BCF|nr:flagellar type III secretion system protein FliR [Kordiimonas laminariae]